MELKNGLVHIDVDQRSLDWYIERKGIPTASSFGKIITSLGKKSTQISGYAYDLVADCYMDEIEESFQSYAMQRGVDLEPIAKNVYMEYSGNSVYECGFFKRQSDGFEVGCSPDGLVDESGIVEIKCPLKGQHIKNLASKSLPAEYVAQVQGQLFIMDRNWCDFVSYNPNFKEGYQIKVFKVFRDDAFIDNLKKYISDLFELKNKILAQLNECFEQN